MGAGCSTDKSDPRPLNTASSKSQTALKKSASGARSGGNASRRTREELAAQFEAEFPVEEETTEEPSYPKGSRERTLLKVFHLLDQANTGLIQVPEWKDYILRAGLTTEDLARELVWIVAERRLGRTPNDPRVSASQFVTAMVHMVAPMDDPAFGRFVAHTLSMYRSTRSPDPNFSEDQVAPLA